MIAQHCSPSPLMLPTLLTTSIDVANATTAARGSSSDHQQKAKAPDSAHGKTEMKSQKSRL
jgi:hypothetical protein